MIKLNKDFIHSVTLSTKEIAPDYYKYLPEIKILGIFVRSAGVYDTLFHTRVLTQEEVDARFKVENNTVYFKPYVSIKFQNKEVHTKFFDTHGAAVEYVQKLNLDNSKFII